MLLLMHKLPAGPYTLLWRYCVWLQVCTWSTVRVQVCSHETEKNALAVQSSPLSKQLRCDIQQLCSAWAEKGINGVCRFFCLQGFWLVSHIKLHKTQYLNTSFLYPNRCDRVNRLWTFVSSFVCTVCELLYCMTSSKCQCYSSRNRIYATIQPNSFIYILPCFDHFQSSWLSISWSFLSGVKCDKVAWWLEMTDGLGEWVMQSEPWGSRLGRARESEWGVDQPRYERESGYLHFVGHN